MAAWPPAGPTSYFVGGQPIWARRASRRALEGLTSISMAEVALQAHDVLSANMRLDLDRRTLMR
jgi:hypothetical protein